jgi:hypothetical protein
MDIKVGLSGESEGMDDWTVNRALVLKTWGKPYKVISPEFCLFICRKINKIEHVNIAMPPFCLNISSPSGPFLQTTYKTVTLTAIGHRKNVLFHCDMNGCMDLHETNASCVEYA